MKDVRYIRVKFSDGTTRRVPLIEPMRPAETKSVPHTGWIAEEKKDGSLTLMYLVNGAVAYVNRKGVDKTAVYPELTDNEPRHMKGMTILEGEAYALKGGTDSFEAFLRRDLLKDPVKARERMHKYPLRFEAFDIIMKNSKWENNEPLLERKKLLKEATPHTKQVSDFPYSTNPKEFTAKMRKDPNAEGVVFKKLGSKYTFGKSKDWLKLKFKKQADVELTGYDKGTGKREDIGAFHMGVFDKRTGKMRNVGNVGTGFTDKELASMKRRFDSGEKLFAKVDYLKVGSQGRLRAPSFVGLREDINSKETHV